MLMQILVEFEQLTGIHVHLRQLDWSSGRRELIHIALDRAGADVSEIGSTWLSELATLNVLRPFERYEQNEMGVPDDYFPSVLQSCMLAGDHRLWALPWMAETLLLYYRRDMLKTAGLFPDIAFRNLPSLQAAAVRLNEAGVAIPFVIPDSRDRFLMLQFLSSLLWQNDADYIHTEGRRFSIDVSPLIDASRVLFTVLRLYSPEGVAAAKAEGVYGAFHLGHAAATLGGMWMNRGSPSFSHAEVLSNYAVTSLAHSTFTGGTNLVVWKSSLRERAALELVKFLNREENLRRIAREANYIPARWREVSGLPEFQNPFHQLFARSVEKGRGYPNLPLWGVVEDQISATLARIWDQVVETPGIDLDDLVVQSFQQLRIQIDVTLSKLK
jgi:multiple sugar transport system substrate-binding protein